MFLKLILSNLSVLDLNTLKTVSQEWFELCCSFTVWERLNERNFDQTFDTQPTIDNLFFWAIKRNLGPAVRTMLLLYRHLIKSDADKGFSPLYRASQRGHLGTIAVFVFIDFQGIVKILIEFGSEVESFKG